MNGFPKNKRLMKQLAVPPDAVEGTAGITAATTSFEAMCHPEGTDQTIHGHD